MPRQQTPPFFYAAATEALDYDHYVRMTDSSYDLVHDVTIQIFRRWLVSVNQPINGHAHILDVGCGTGAEAMRLLHELPHSRMLCVDHSRPMLDAFGKKLCRAYGDGTAGGRAHLAQADFSLSGWLDLATNSLEGIAADTKFHAALSVYALHHLDLHAKREVYRTIASRLPDGAIFVNADLCTFSTPWLAMLALEHADDWIVGQFDGASPESNRVAAELGPRRHSLKQAWLDHVRNDNKPLPLWQNTRQSEAEVPSEAELLRDAGFTVVEVPFRHYQSAVVVAIK